MPAQKKRLIAAHWINWINWILLFVLTGCMGTKDSILPQDGPTMREVYDNHFMGGGSRNLPIPMTSRQTIKGRSIAAGYGDLAGYTRRAQSEIQSIFQRLPNPTLVMYVYTHLSRRGQYPIPGYSTSFTLYEKVEYALPGEVPGLEP